MLAGLLLASSYPLGCTVARDSLGAHKALPERRGQATVNIYCGTFIDIGLLGSQIKFSINSYIPSRLLGGK